jgi:hypothetical protein
MGMGDRSSNFLAVIRFHLPIKSQMGLSRSAADPLYRQTAEQLTGCNTAR